jgi:hypothetical protein
MKMKFIFNYTQDLTRDAGRGAGGGRPLEGRVTVNVSATINQWRIMTELAMLRGLETRYVPS